MDYLYYLFGSAAILVVLLLVAAVVFLFIMVGWMAEQRGRSVAGWVIISLFLSTPLLAIVFLFFLGDTDNRKIERIEHEEEVRLMLRNRYGPKESQPNTSAMDVPTFTNRSGSMINDLYSNRR